MVILLALTAVLIVSSVIAVVVSDMIAERQALEAYMHAARVEQMRAIQLTNTVQQIMRDTEARNRALCASSHSQRMSSASNYGWDRSWSTGQRYGF